MAFFFAPSASTSESTSLSSSPNVTSPDNLKDDDNQSPTSQTQKEGNLPSLASDLSSPRDHPFSRAESEIYTTTTNPALDPITFDVDVDASRTWASPSSSRSSPDTISSQSSGSGFSSSNGSERAASPILAPWVPLGETSRRGSNSVSTPASASSAPTIKPHAISLKDKGKAPAYPTTVRTDGAGHHRSRSSGETKSRRSTKQGRTKGIDENGISRDFLLIVALCIGLACAGVILVRPAMLALFGHGGFELDDL